MGTTIPTLHDAADAARFRRLRYWRDRLLVDYLDDAARRTPDKPALIDNRGTLTYRALARRTRNLAASLLKRGVGAGDVVAVQAPNWAELPTAHFALDRIGAVFLPVHDGFRGEELTQILGRAQARAVIAPADYRGVSHRGLYDAVAGDLPALGLRIVLRATPRADEIAFDALCAEEGWRQTDPGCLARARPDAQAPLQVLVSSGTTAHAKCSLFSDNNMTFKLIEQYGRCATHLGAADIAAAIAPAGTGATGYNYPIVAALLHGATAVLLERWDGRRPEEAMRLIAAHRCTWAVLIPTQLVKMIRSPALAAHDLSCLRFVSVAGAKLADADAEAAEKSLGCPVQTIYGATDAGVPTMTHVDDPPAKRRTAGRVLPGEELRIVRDDASAAPAGEVGEVLWRGANASYGYLNPTVEMNAAWDRDGWFHSGDLGVLDDAGYLTIVGRKKDMIIRGGRNISPQQIEHVLLAHPKVVEAAVLSVPDDVLGELIGAVVIPSAAGAPTLAELAAFVLHRGLATWCQPERLLLVEDFPRNAGGKTDKRALAAALAAAPQGVGERPRQQVDATGEAR